MPKLLEELMSLEKKTCQLLTVNVIDRFNWSKCGFEYGFRNYTPQKKKSDQNA